MKLHQFDADDDRQFAVNTANGEWLPSTAAGVDLLPLHEFGKERVALIRFAPDTTYPSHVHEGGEEVLVLEGQIRDQHGEYPAGAWMRFPDRSEHEVTSAADGALLYVKVGHLS